MIRNFAVSQRNLVVASLFFSLCVHIRHTHHGDFSTDLIVLTIGDICVFAVAQLSFGYLWSCDCKWANKNNPKSPRVEFD